MRRNKEPTCSTRAVDDGVVLPVVLDVGQPPSYGERYDDNIPSYSPPKYTDIFHGRENISDYSMDSNI
jgi:hypothetical protein